MKPPLKPLLTDLKQFALQLSDESGSSPSAREFSIHTTMFSDARYGLLGLSGEEGDRYARIVSDLCNAMGEVMSEDSITRHVQLAIFKTLDIRKERQTESAQDRATEAIQELENSLTASPPKWLNCIPIIGIDPPDEPWSLGDVTLINIASEDGTDFLNRVDRITDSTTGTEQDKQSAKDHHRQILVADHAGQAFALVSTTAIDAEAAWDLAKLRLRFKLDCLNFAVDCLHGPSPFYEFSDSEPLKRRFESGLVLNTTDYSRAYVPASVKAPVLSLLATQFRSQVEENPPLQRLCQLLRADQTNKHEDRVLGAVHWAGKASAERRPEEAFLFRAISLESLLLGDGESVELTNRLALSVVHLLGQSSRSREETFKRVKFLYGVRSKIVHSGKYQIGKDDADSMRLLVLECLTRVLADEPFRNMSGKKDLDDWFWAAMRGDEPVP